MKEVNLLIWTIVGILIGIFISILIHQKTIKTDQYYYKPYVEDIYFSDKELKHYLRQVNIKFPEIVYAQALLETGNFKSEPFIKYNNLFGMKMSLIRPTTALYYENGYAVYRNWRESVLDYALYQAYYHDSIKSSEDYYHVLENYAEDSLYIKKIKILSNQW